MNLYADEVLDLSDDTFIAKPHLFDLFFPTASFDLSGSGEPAMSATFWREVRSSKEATEAIIGGYHKIASCCGFSVDHHGWIYPTPTASHRFLAWANAESPLDEKLKHAYVALTMAQVHGYSSTHSAAVETFPFAPPLRKYVAGTFRRHRSSEFAQRWVEAISESTARFKAG